MLRPALPIVCALSLLACPKPDPSADDETDTETGPPPSCLDADPAGADIIINSDDDIAMLMLGDCVPGKILVSGGTITDISGLITLREVGSLEIRYNPMLPTLAGIEGLERVDELIIVGNPLITTLPEFGSLTTLGRVNVSTNTGLLSLGNFPLITTMGGLTVGANNLLPAVDGFAGLTGTTGDMVLSGNPLFTSFASLAELAVIGGALEIEDNPELQEIAMPVLTTVGGNLTIVSNPTLSECLVADLIAVLDVGGATLASGNQPDACD